MAPAISTFTFISAALCLCAGCKSPSVNLATSEPIKVDINMKLDVYQRTENATKAPPVVKTASDDVQVRRRNRMGEVQSLKDSRLVGENHSGLLSVRNAPPGDYGQYVQRTVDAENSDRETEMRRLALERAISLEELRREQAELTRANAFNGEWIEMPLPNGGYEWKKKGQ